MLNGEWIQALLTDGGLKSASPEGLKHTSREDKDLAPLRIPVLGHHLPIAKAAKVVSQVNVSKPHNIHSK